MAQMRHGRGHAFGRSLGVLLAEFAAGDAVSDDGRDQIGNAVDVRADGLPPLFQSATMTISCTFLLSVKFSTRPTVQLDDEPPEPLGGRKPQPRDGDSAVLVTQR